MKIDDFDGGLRVSCLWISLYIEYYYTVLPMIRVYILFGLLLMVRLASITIRPLILKLMY